MIRRFKLIGRIRLIQTVAVGNRIREIRELRETYGTGRWRKRKGVALVSLPNGTIRHVELYWYEAHGIGRKKLKVKRYLD